MKSWLRRVFWNNGASDSCRFTNLKCWLRAGGRGVFRYPYHPTSRVLNQWTSLVKFLAPYCRVLKNLRICMFYPNICMFFIKTDRFCLQFKVICREIPSFWQSINMVRARYGAHFQHKYAPGRRCLKINHFIYAFLQLISSNTMCVLNVALENWDVWYDNFTD